jgi:hypothetical protein
MTLDGRSKRLGSLSVLQLSRDIIRLDYPPSAVGSRIPCAVVPSAPVVLGTRYLISPLPTYESPRQKEAFVFSSPRERERETLRFESSRPSSPLGPGILLRGYASQAGRGSQMSGTEPLANPFGRLAFAKRQQHFARWPRSVNMKNQGALCNHDIEVEGFCLFSHDEWCLI